MRILNTKDANKKYSRFSMPGFRSGSMIKRIIACMYYFFILVLAANSIRVTLTGNFGSAADVFVAVCVELIIILILLVPVIFVGLSDYYDWHGIKLFLLIMFSWCVLFTTAQFVSTLFSDEFINSKTPPVDIPSDISAVTSSGDAIANPEIDNSVIIDNLEYIGVQSHGNAN